MDFDRDIDLFTTFANTLEASDEDVETILQLQLIDVHYSDELRSFHKECDLFNFYKCLPKDKNLNLRQKAAVC
jgi:hypothetical protein